MNDLLGGVNGAGHGLQVGYHGIFRDGFRAFWAEPLPERKSGYPPSEDGERVVKPLEFLPVISTIFYIYTSILLCIYHIIM